MIIVVLPMINIKDYAIMHRWHNKIYNHNNYGYNEMVTVIVTVAILETQITVLA